MELLADRDAEEARKFLDPVLERMMEAVHHYEGTVNLVMGGGIMALFGAPLDDPKLRPLIDDMLSGTDGVAADERAAVFRRKFEGTAGPRDIRASFGDHAR